MNQNKKPSRKKCFSDWTTTELMQLALFFQCLALAFQIGALILTIARLFV